MRVVCVPSALLVRRGCVNPAGGRAAPVASKLSRYSDASGTSTNQSVSMTASTRRYSGCQKQKPPPHRCGGFVGVGVGGGGGNLKEPERFNDREQGGLFGVSKTKPPASPLRGFCSGGCWRGEGNLP